MKKLAGIGSEVDVDFGAKGIKRCVIEYLRQKRVGVRLLKGTKTHDVAQGKILL